MTHFFTKWLLLGLPTLGLAVFAARVPAQEGAVVDPAAIPAVEAPPEASNVSPASDAPGELADQEESADEAVVPLAYPEDRYLAMWEKNPFVLETASVIQKVENFSKDWTLAGISASGGVYTVRIFNKQTGSYQRLREGQAGGEFRLESVNYHKDRNQSSVKVSRGTETAELKYDDSLASRPVTVNNTMATPAGDPNQPGQGGGANPNLPPGAQASLMQRGPNGQPLNPGAPGAVGVRPGMPGYVPGRPGGNPAGGTAGVDPTTGAPLPAAVNAYNPAGVPVVNPATGTPGALPGGVPTPVSRRRQLIPAPIQQKQ